MHLIEGIKSRRSIRKFTDQDISKTDIQDIIECWMHAPSAHNQQAREFFIIDKQEEKDFLTEQLTYGKMISWSNKAIICCFNKEHLKSPNYIAEDMGACCQNMLLAAHEKGIGGVWVGIYPEEVESWKQIKEHFQLPKEIEVFNIIALGYPDPNGKQRNKECIKPERIHWL